MAARYTTRGDRLPRSRSDSATEATITSSLAILLVGVVIGAIIDLRTHRIPNWLTFSLMAVGIVSHIGMPEGITFGLIGLGAAFAIHYALWTLGIDAAGDAKLFMAVGAFLGWATMVEATLWRLLIHIPFALVLLTVFKRWDNFRAALRWSLQRAQGVTAGDRPEPTYIPLGPVIALSVPLAVWTGWLEFFG